MALLELIVGMVNVPLAIAIVPLGIAESCPNLGHQLIERIAMLEGRRFAQPLGPSLTPLHNGAGVKPINDFRFSPNAGLFA